MNLPPGFSVSLPGGVTVVTCQGCGESRDAVYGTAAVEAWATTHQCQESSDAGATVDR